MTTTEAAPLLALQRGLERLYDLPAAAAVLDFLITDAALARVLEGAAEAPRGERVLVREAEDALDVSVYLDAEALARLASQPLSAAPAGLPDLWDALEGVSHFVCLAWHAHHERPVSRLELELQAEVDKFVTTAALAASAAGGVVPRWLHAALFDAPGLDPALDAEARDRYRAANRYAARYCRSLERRFLAADAPGLGTELRRFYRMDRTAKLGHIDTLT